MLLGHLRTGMVGLGGGSGGDAVSLCDKVVEKLARRSLCIAASLSPKPRVETLTHLVFLKIKTHLL